MKKKKCAGILLAISMFISGGCTENRQEDTEIRKPVTISILADSLRLMQVQRI